MATVTYAWEFVEGSFFVNTTFQPGAQSASAVTALPDGSGYFVTWDHPSGSVQGNIVNSDGTIRSGEFLVNSTTDNAQEDSSVTALTGGNIVVTFTDYSVDAGGDIRARLFTSTGTAVDLDFGISTSDFDDTNSDVAALADGGFVVTWTRDFGTDLDTRMMVFNADGSARSGSTLVESSGTVSSSDPQVTGLANGNFVVVWDEQPAAGGDTEARFAIYDADGNEVLGSTVIDTIGTMNEDVQVVALQDGGFAVAYVDSGWSVDGITFEIFNSDGSIRSGWIQVHTSAGSHSNPTLTVLSNGYIVVGWQDGDGSHYQAYDPAGNAVGANTFIAGSIIESEIAALTGGLVANVRSSTIVDAASDDSIRSSINELVRTTIGDSSNESLSGDSLRDILNGAGGNDILDGGSNDDELFGGSGIDELFGGDGNDRLHGGTGADTLHGGFGDDTFIIDDAGDLIVETSIGGYDTARSSITYTITGFVETLILTGSDNINGTGNGRDNILWGNTGNNYLNGAGGADSMRGLTGDDVYTINHVDDRAIENFGSGNDRVNSSVTLVLGSNIERLVLVGTAEIDGTGNNLANVMYGNNSANFLVGRGGNDFLYGRAGNDRLYGNEGNDRLEGGIGNDWLEGHVGTDRYYGGAGADQYVYRDGHFGGMTSSTADRIHDFSQADGDRIRLDYVDADTGTGGDQAFTFIGNGAFTGTAGELQYFVSVGNTYVAGDTDGDGAADFWIRVDGLHTLDTGDFVL